MPDFSLSSDRVDAVGSRLTRPECVLCTRAGDLFVSNWQGGVTRLTPEGREIDILGHRPGQPPVGTNGFAIDARGRFLLADLHGEGGGVWRLHRDGLLEPFLLEIDGHPLPPANFVGVDRQGRTWITVSTWRQPRHEAYRPDWADGFIVLVDERGARLAAEGLAYTNEAIVHPSGDWLYVNETFGRRTSRMRILPNGDLGPRETVCTYGAGTFPDGLAFDAEGGFWMTSVVSNRLIRVDAEGTQRLILEDCDPEALAMVEEAFQAGALGREHLDSLPEGRLGSISSIAFGGPDLRTAYLGNLLDRRIYRFTAPVAGAPPAHWDITFPD